MKLRQRGLGSRLHMYKTLYNYIDQGVFVHHKQRPDKENGKSGNYRFWKGRWILIITLILY